MIIPTDKDIRTITDMRENTLELLHSLQKKQDPTVIMHRNSPKAILLSIKRYNQLMSMLEDYLDEELAVALEKKALKATKKDYLPLKQVYKELGIDV